MARAKIVTVIYTEETRGEGTAEDPVRSVPQLWTVDGELICDSENTHVKEGRGFFGSTVRHDVLIGLGRG